MRFGHKALGDDRHRSTAGDLQRCGALHSRIDQRVEKILSLRIARPIDRKRESARHRKTAAQIHVPVGDRDRDTRWNGHRDASRNCHHAAERDGQARRWSRPGVGIVPVTVLYRVVINIRHVAPPL